ncbi:MAG: B12-binding domain-containing radical SAM protein [Candidatus Sumerlaeia bacterium]|nr:B12-binding domain-containing radical SAM protein [Candidatus Sumerlaeia bacterium]
MSWKKIKRALLLVPPTGLFIREDRCQTPIEELKTVALRPPIELMYAGAMFERGGCQCRLRDYPAERLNWDDLAGEIREFQPDLLLISATLPSLESDLHSATLAKEINPTIITVAKGAHFNIFDRETLAQFKQLDIVLRREYEYACLELAQGRPLSEIAGITFRNEHGEIIRTPDRPFIENLDELPFPARHLVRNELYIRPDTMEPQTTVVTNRGCPYNCIFCLSGQIAGRKNRVRSVDNIVAELRECVARFNIRNFLFRSDLFTANKQWVIQLCQRLIAEFPSSSHQQLSIQWSCNSRVDTLDEEMLEWMRRAGCWLIAFGVEKGSNEMLEKINKRTTIESARRAVALTKKAGIKSSIYLLFGLPWDTPEVLQQDIDFAIELDADFLEIFYVYPFPGTPLYQQAIELGLLKAGEFPTSAYSAPAMPSLYLSREELMKWRRRALRQYYLRPRFIYRTLRQAGSLKAVTNYARYGVIQLADLLTHK